MARLTQPLGNNKFCFNQVSNPKLWIAEIIDGTANDLEIGENTVFREMKNGKVAEYKGLKNFIKIKKNNQSIYIFDNHNHALEYRLYEYKNGNIDFGIKLVHLDQHTDMNTSEYALDLQNPTFEVYNVGNFIQPAINCGLVSNVEQINTEYKLLNFELPNCDYILDIDLDFRAPEMSIEKYSETIQRTKKLISKSRVVTIATSPYFIDQGLAIKICKSLL